MASERLRLYEAIGAASARMLAAARADDWPGLQAAEADCAALIERARGDRGAFSVDEQTRRQQIIRRVLADDAEIRDRLQPWLARLETLLRGADAGRRMQRDYRA